MFLVYNDIVDKRFAGQYGITVIAGNVV